MTSRMIPAGTTLMFLAILYFILIAVQGIRRKLRLKQLIASLFLFAAGAAWIAVCLHEYYLFTDHYPLTSIFSKVPFGNLIYHNIPEISVRYQPLFTRYFIVTFLFAVVWGVCLPYLIKQASYRKLLQISAIVLIPCELLFMVLCYTGISYDTVFDFGCFFLLFLGITIGWKIYAILQERSKTAAKKKKGAEEMISR